MFEVMIVVAALGALMTVLIAHMAQMAYMKGILDHFDKKFDEVIEKTQKKK